MDGLSRLFSFFEEYSGWPEDLEKSVPPQVLLQKLGLELKGFDFSVRPCHDLRQCVILCLKGSCWGHFGHAEFQCEWLMPNVPEVVEDSSIDALREQSTCFAFRQMSVVQKSSNFKGKRCRAHCRSKPYAHSQQWQQSFHGGSSRAGRGRSGGQGQRRVRMYVLFSSKDDDQNQHNDLTSVSRLPPSPLQDSAGPVEPWGGSALSDRSCGSCLSRYLQHWEELGADPWALKVQGLSSAVNRALAKS